MIIGRVFRTLPNILSSAIELYGEVIIPAVFALFFILGAFACIQRGRTRRIYVIGVVCCLLISSGFALTVVPFIHAQRYSNIADTTYEPTSIYLVDSSGKEIKLDTRVTLPVRDFNLSTKLLEDMTDEQRIEASQEILSDGEGHRDRMQDGIPRWRHPPPAVANYWNASELEQYDRFISVRIYQSRVMYEKDSHKVMQTDQERNCLLEIVPDSQKVYNNCNV